MKVFFLDDDKIRLKKAKPNFIGCEWFEAETAEDAIKVLTEHSPFDLVSLDHDLGGNVYCPSDEVSGHEVAKFITTLPADKLPKRIIIHSFNPVGAQSMQHTFDDAGIRSLRIPFDYK